MLLSLQRFVSFYKGKGDKSRIKGTILGALKISGHENEKSSLSMEIAFTFVLIIGKTFFSRK